MEVKKIPYEMVLQVTEPIQKYGIVLERHVQKMSSFMIPRRLQNINSEEADSYENTYKDEDTLFWTKRNRSGVHNNKRDR